MSTGAQHQHDDDIDIESLLTAAAENLASDIHLRAGAPPFFRVDGQLIPTEAPALTPEGAESMATSMMGERHLRTFRETGEVDFAYTLPGVGRFRVCAFRQRGLVSTAIRRVLPGAPPLDSLGLPAIVRALCDERRGLVIVSGMAASGKTTTTAAMINHLNETRRSHIITIEDPIEITHHDRSSIVDQREVGQDTPSFANALTLAVRQDPDVLFVSELKGREIASGVLRAAATGNLVITTMQAIDTVDCINQVIDLFEPHQQQHARLQLATTLRAIVSQRLVPRADGVGRVPAVEVCVMNARIFDMILTPGLTGQINGQIEDGAFYGMQTFDQALIEMFKAGTVSVSDATAASSNPNEFPMKLRAAGLAW